MSKDLSENRKSSPEKSNFAQTYNRLSQYLKEKGRLRDLNLGINAHLDASSAGRPETSAAKTTNLFSDTTDKLGQISKKHDMKKPMSFFPQYVAMSSFNTTPDAAINNNANFSEEAAAVVEGKTAQMTIFYGGQVMVFDNYSEEKAKEIMVLASKNCSSTCTATATGGFVSKTSNNNIVNVEDKMGKPSSSNTNIVSTPGTVEVENQTKCEQPMGSDLPIARRASLHRFFARRKDRASVRAPYQLHDPSSESPKFDLNL